MNLSNSSVNASVAVSDLDKAREFYEARLGLSEGTNHADGSRIYRFGGGTSLHVYPSSCNKRQRGDCDPRYLARGRFEQVVDELTSNGVTFERYDEPPLKTDDKGIQVIDDGKVAWFRDPDGNTFAIEQ